MPELAEELGVEAALLAPARRLVAIGRIRARLARRRPRSAGAPAHGSAGPRARDEQRAALGAIGALPAGGELLLEGVAASGKTDVYMAAIHAALQAGNGAIVIVPEVSLIPQLADRLRGVVGDELAVLHSGLSAGERHDEWWRILRGEARVVVGTRTAIFAPLGPGLIVVDEEHDGGYKSDRTPRYDARWVARRRAALPARALVFGTATPDLVTLASVRGGHAERARSSSGGWAAPASRWSTCAPSWPTATGRSSRPRWPALGAPASRNRAGRPAHEPARRRDVHPLPGLRREPALPGLRSALRLPPHRRGAALPPLRPHGRAGGALPAVRQQPHPLLRRRHAARRGRAASAVPGPAGRPARLGRARRSARLRGGLRRLPRRPDRRARRHAAGRQGPRPAVGHPGGGRSRPT